LLFGQGKDLRPLGRISKSMEHKFSLRRRNCY